MVQGKQIIYGANVEFRQSSKPTVRSDGSALQAGDRWLDTTERIWFYWNGTYWLSEEIFDFSSAVSGLTGSSTPGGLPTFTTYNIYLLRFDLSYEIASGTLDGSNRWGFGLVRDDSASATTEASYSLNSGSGGVKDVISTALNVHRDISALGTKFFRMNFTRTGAPPTLTRAASIFYYRLAKP